MSNESGRRLARSPRWSSTPKKMFFQLDTDGSGSLDKDEIGVMMRQLGQNPTDEELVDLIKSVDDDETDGKIQLREFLTLYTRGLDTKDKPGMGDVNNVWAALGGDVRDTNQTVAHDKVHDQIFNDYGLDVDFSATFGVSKVELVKADFEDFLLKSTGD